MVFLSLTGLFLERTYRTNVITGAQQQMQPMIFSLMGSAEERDATPELFQWIFSATAATTRFGPVCLSDR